MAATYTIEEVEEITRQLQAIKVNGKNVFLAFIDDTSRVYHTIRLDNGNNTGVFEFHKAEEDTYKKRDML